MPIGVTLGLCSGNYDNGLFSVWGSGYRNYLGLRV